MFLISKIVSRIEIRMPYDSLAINQIIMES